MTSSPQIAGRTIFYKSKWNHVPLLLGTLQCLHSTFRIKSNQLTVHCKAPGSPSFCPPSCSLCSRLTDVLADPYTCQAHAQACAHCSLDLARSFPKKILPWPSPPTLVRIQFKCNLIRNASLFSSKFPRTHHLLLLWPTLFSSKHLSLWNHIIYLLICVNVYYVYSLLHYKP